MPLNDFFSYRIRSHEAGHIEALLNIVREHPIFDGHFPGNPVTPGVTQIEMVRQVISACLKKNLMLTTAREIKYLNPILSQHTHGIELTIDYSEDHGNISVRCLLSQDDHIFTKIRGVFSE